MARRGSELTVKAEELETQPKGITRRKKEEISPVNKAQAIAIEELEIAFDDDLRMAIIQSLVRNKQLILQQASSERQISQALELARLEAIEKAREEGKQQARSEMALKKEEQKIAIQKQFVQVELPQLLDSCDYLGYEIMKKTIDDFAARVGVVLEWEELEDGEFRCTPSFT